MHALPPHLKNMPKTVKKARFATGCRRQARAVYLKKRRGGMGERAYTRRSPRSPASSISGKRIAAARPAFS